MEYVLNVEKDNSGVKLVWKDTDDNIVETCIITTEETLQRIEETVNELTLESDSINSELVMKVIRENGGAGSGINSETLQGSPPSYFVNSNYFKEALSSMDSLKLNKYDAYTKAETDNLLKNKQDNLGGWSKVSLADYSRFTNVNFMVNEDIRLANLTLTYSIQSQTQGNTYEWATNWIPTKYRPPKDIFVQKFTLNGSFIITTRGTVKYYAATTVSSSTTPTASVNLVWRY